MKPELRLILALLLAGLWQQATADARPWRVVLLESMSVPVIVEGSSAFRAHLQGLVESHAQRQGQAQALSLTRLHAEGSRELGAQRLRAQLQQTRPDLVVAIATIATQASHDTLAATNIPALFFNVTDPAGAGVIARNEGPPGGNMTGLIYGIDRSTKLDLALRALGPAARGRKIRIGFIHTDYPASMGDLRMLEAAVDRQPDIELLSHRIAYQPIPGNLEPLLLEVRSAVEQLQDRIDYWWAPLGPLGERDEYSQLLASISHRPLLVGANLASVAAGALLFIGPDIKAQAEEAAEMALSLLLGDEPGRIPVRTPRRYRLGLNLDSARRMGAVIPADILELAADNLYVNGALKPSEHGSRRPTAVSDSR